MSSAGFRTTVLPQTSAGTELPRRDRDREVPRGDRADHAHRHPDAHHELVAELRRRGLAEEPPALPAHVVAHVDRFLDVAAGLRLHLPHLAGHQVGELGLTLLEQLREAEEDVAALGRRDEAPVLPGLARRRDRALDVGRRRAREGLDHLAGGRVQGFEGGCRHPAIVARRQPSGRPVSGKVPVTRARRRSRTIAALLELRVVVAGTAIGAFATIDHHRHVRVVTVVLDHLVEELRLELLGDHAVDHRLSVGSRSARSRAQRGISPSPPTGGRYSGRSGRPLPCASSTP